MSKVQPAREVFLVLRESKVFPVSEVSKDRRVNPARLENRVFRESVVFQVLREKMVLQESRGLQVRLVPEVRLARKDLRESPEKKVTSVL